MTEFSSRSGKGLRTARRRVVAALTFCVCLSQFLYTKALAPNGEALQLGPVYTSGDGKKSPEFPVLQVVVARAGDGLAGPQPAELTLIEDGVEGGHATKVASFDSTGYGLAAVVAIDVSGSMSGKPLKTIRESLYKFVSDARSQDSVGVVTIADSANLDVPFGTDKATMQTRLQALQTRGKLTRLYDGMLTAMGEFSKSLSSRRELTVISDGHDEGSQATLEQVVQMARDRGIAIDSIGLTRSAPQYLQTLSTLASETGGTFHQVHDDQELDSLIGNGMKALKATPVATFEAKHIPGDGKKHALGVRWASGSNKPGETTLAGKTTFIAPKLSFLQTMMRKLKDIPTWGYGALALVCFGLLIAVILTIRRLKRRDAAVGNVPYELPAQPYSPGVPYGAAHDDGVFSGGHPGNGLAGGAPPIAGFERQADTAGMKLPDMKPPDIAPRVPPAIKQPVPPVIPEPAGRSKQTRIAGVFDASENTIARLDILTGALSGTSVAVTRGEFWIGAAAGNQFVISNDATVSSRHAYLIFEDPILMLVDNRSTNGTRINGKMLQGSRQPLHDGDQIQIGQTMLRLKSMS